MCIASKLFLIGSNCDVTPARASQTLHHLADAAILRLSTLKPGMRGVAEKHRRDTAVRVRIRSCFSGLYSAKIQWSTWHSSFCRCVQI